MLVYLFVGGICCSCLFGLFWIDVEYLVGFVFVAVLLVYLRSDFVNPL